MATQDENFASCRDVPNVGRIGTPASDKFAAVARKRDLGEKVHLSPDFGEELPGPWVPESNRAVAGCGRQFFAYRGEFNKLDMLCIDFLNAFAVISVPDGDLSGPYFVPVYRNAGLRRGE